MSAPHARHSAHSGFTLIEVLIAVSLLALVLGSLGLANSSSRRAYRTGAVLMDVETRGTRILRELVDELRLADISSLSTVPAPPLSVSTVDFQTSQGFNGKRTQWSDPLRIQLDADGRVRIVESPGLAEERARVIGRSVPDLLAGETLDGTDENGNGLVDEAGLCFSRSGNMLTVRLTVQGVGPDGRTLTRTWVTNLHCRN